MIKDDSFVTFTIRSIHQILFRKSLGQKDKRSNGYVSKDINNSPNGDDQTAKNGYSALRELEAVGSRMKNSRSLQNLETATFESLRNVAEKTGGLGSNIRQRYGSHVDVAFGKYEQLGDSDLDGRGSRALRWR